MTEAKHCTTSKEVNGRPLGFYESLSISFPELHSSGDYWQIAVINTLQPLQDDDVIKACKILVRKQSILQMRILRSDLRNTYHFEPMENREKIDFTSVTLQNKDSWPDLISRDNKRTLIDILNGPLWRIILCRIEIPDCTEHFPYQYTILLNFVHAIVDGISAFDLVNQQFLPILLALMNNTDTENIIPYLPILSSAEDIFPLSKISLSGASKLSLDILRWKNRVFKPAKLPEYMFTGEKLSLVEEFDLKEEPCFPKIFDEQTCIPVIEAAKKRSITVHCVLLTAGAVALSRTASLAGVKLPSAFNQIWPISLRKFVDLKSPQPLGFLVADGITTHETRTDYTSDEFWMSCKSIQREIEKDKRQERCIQYLRRAKYFRDVAEKTDLDTVLTEMGSPPALALSNIGKQNNKDAANGPIKMRIMEQYFTLTGTEVTKWCPMTQFVLTFEQKFMWTIAYNPRKVSVKFVETYLEYLQAVLKTYCRD